MGSLELSKISFGYIDAKDELLSKDAKNSQSFMEAFCVPPNIDVEDFLTENKFIISGLKGTGKTALLRYLANKIKEKNKSAHTEFVLFKSEFSEEQRKEFSRVAGFANRETRFVESPNSDVDSFSEVSGSDFETVWLWFLHKLIVDLIDTNKVDLFVRNQNFEKYRACVKSPKLSGENSGIRRLIPNLKKGSVEISSSPKFNLDFEWDDKEKNLVNFNVFSRQIHELFKRLNPSSGKIFICLDELDYGSGDEIRRGRDASLIRDLIVVVNKIREVCSERCYPINFIVAIRSEVLKNVAVLGKEVNKIHDQFGQPIFWHQSGERPNHPLLEIIERRINVSESINRNQETADVWKEYFPAKIHNERPQDFILHQTLYRPRDLVRLFKVGIDLNKKERVFAQKVFDSSRKLYSEKCWEELSEELLASYSPVELGAIETIFLGFKGDGGDFSLQDLKTQVSGKAELYSEVKSLLEKHSVTNILEDLYRVGVIINTVSGKVRSSFRGDSKVILEGRFFVHRALRARFTV